MSKLAKYLATGAGVLLSLYLYTNKLSNYNRTISPSSTLDYASVTVMVTRMDGQSGGTGVVVYTSPNESKILTNGHVCSVVKNGGLVKSDTLEATVASYQVSNAHDLCLINVKADFRTSATLAPNAPKIYTDSVVSGHPMLLPTVLNKGHFSHKTVITVLTGLKPCSKDDLDSDMAAFCVFLGGIPVFKTYEAQVISNLILPGNSGSAVYNSNGEISGLVFAGSSGLNYAFIVPYEYVEYFLNEEVAMIKPELPIKEMTLSNSEEKNTLKKAKDNCKNTSKIKDERVSEFCDQLYNNTIVYY